MKTRVFFLIIVFSITAMNLNSQKLPRLGKDQVSKVVAAMTLDEKASLVVGTGMRFPGMNPGSADTGQKDAVPGAAGSTFAIPRLGIPSIIVADGPAGLRISPDREGDDKKYYCTAFPIASLLASSWDRDLVGRVGEAMGNEVLEYGVDVILGPGMNIQRNPLGGRNFEYFSEDPFITGEMAASIIKGIQSNGVGTSPKHFAANNAETNRNALNTIVSERALREIYLKGFSMAVTGAQPWTIMSSYNLINDVYAPENTDLLTNILRGDWGFKGLVITDWFGGNDPVAMMKAGNDLLMPGVPNQKQAILQAVQDGNLSVDVLDRNVSRILNLILQSPHFRGYKYSNETDLKDHAEVARVAGSDGMVLLKNTSYALPLTDVRKVALFGNSSYNLISGGTGSGDVNEAYTVSLAEGMRNAGYTVSENLQKLYGDYMELARIGRPAPKGIMALMGAEPIEELHMGKDVIKGVAATSEAAIITIGRISGEGRDRTNRTGDFRLTDDEQQLIKDVCEVYKPKGKKVIVVLNVGGVIETASWKEQPDAILLAWQAGQEAGNSIADIISGKINPSGKLAVTFPVNYEDVPSAKTFPGTELPERKPGNDSPLNSFMRVKPSLVYYEDGIYVGYRYYETFDVKPSYEFGYGLSYTGFEYSAPKLSSTKFSRSLNVSVEVKNIGKAAGREIVQLYLSAPAKKLDKPAEELKGFAKTRLLQPGESQTVSFTLDAKSLSSFDPAASAWVAEAGNYEVRIGASSRNIMEKATFSLAKDVTVQKVSKSLVPKDKIKELKPGK
ncbi:MAG TPA: glycoside hydrolase family 3 C-terminal domain-containing protein [Bacteroidales bacterium]|nr:glycoside hydrolase family 3 C-terminal domain-containing protein [Bacteroidales bacterium]